MRDCSNKTTTNHDTVSVSQQVVEAVAEAEGIDPVDLDPLYTTIDPDALDALIKSQQSSCGVSDSSITVQFTYHGYKVQVNSEGQVVLTESDQYHS